MGGAAVMQFVPDFGGLVVVDGDLAEVGACFVADVLCGRGGVVRLPSFSGHPICTDPVSVGEDVHCESTAQEVHAGVPA